MRIIQHYNDVNDVNVNGVNKVNEPAVNVRFRVIPEFNLLQHNVY